MAPPVRYCIPGERLCNLEEGSPGSGTYTRHGYIFSSLAGCLTKSSENGAVSSINSRFAKVHILYVGSTPLKNSFRGTIRKEDVRATEKDKVEIYKSFRPGDIVLAKVVSFILSRLLTGLRQILEVLGLCSNSIFSLPGVQMVPISWCEMQCPKTHTKEFRKVARVQPEFLQT
ncbi:exosome complex component CSL4 [Orycteropus afer afer]|uniref:Exosome complex component CSL4 n=1 Tax=Orycteropus afer afer TaxID=1230840 RepID=A0A8B6ZW87_ORYAF|nr:exosome complex component CSL4 [Orycteropus afer afer]